MALMSPQAIIDRWYMAVTIWGEARGAGVGAMRLVAWVIRNRRDDPKRRWPRTIPDVCTQPKQFSVWNPGDPNRPKLADPLGGPPLDDAAFLEALKVADEVLRADESHNPLPRVYWYHDRTIQRPAWTKGLVPIAWESSPFVFYYDPEPREV